MNGFVLSHVTPSYIDIIKNGYIKIPEPDEEGYFGKSDEIFFELMSINMPKTAVGLSLYYSPKLLEKYDATFQVSWSGDKEYKFNKSNIKKDLIRFEKLYLKSKNEEGFGNQIIIHNVTKIPNKYLIGVQNPIYMYIDPYGYLSRNQEFAQHLHMKDKLRDKNRKKRRQIDYYLKKYNYKSVVIVKNITYLL